MWRLPHASPPNHRSQCRQMEKVTRERQKTTDYANMFEEKIQGSVQTTKAKAEAEEEAQGGKVQVGGKQQRKKELARMR